MATFSKEEHQRFPAWLDQELRGKQEDMFQWFQRLWAGHRQTVAWEACYPNQPYDSAQANRLNSQLIEKIELFMAMESLRTDSLSRLYYLNRFAIRRSAEKAYPQTIRKSRKRLKKQPVRDHTHYRVVFELDRLDSEFQNLFPGNQIQRYEISPETAEIHAERFLLYYEVELAFRRLNRQEGLRVRDTFAYEQLQGAVSKGEGGELGPLYLRLWDWLASASPWNEVDIGALIDLFQEQFSLFRPDARFNTANLIQNKLIRTFMINQDTLLVQQIFEFYAWLLAHGDIWANRYFYQNLVRISLKMASLQSEEAARQNYFEQAHRFLEQYRNRLPSQEQEDVYRYNLLHIQFAEGQYEKVSRQFYPETFRDYLYEVQYLLLWMKARYELGKYEDLPERLQNLYTRVRNNPRLTPSYRLRFGNQIQFFRKLILAYQPGQLAKLAEVLQRETAVFDKEWLLAKVRAKKG